MNFNFLAFVCLVSFAVGQTPAQPVDPQLRQAINEYADLIKEHPNEPLLHYNIGNLLYHSGEYEQALHEYRNAINTGDRGAQANIYYNLGNSLYRAGEYEESKAFFRRALELNPVDNDARINYELSRLQQQEEQQQEEQESPAKDQEQENEEEGDGESSQEQGESNQEDQSETGDDQQEGDEQDQQQNPAERQESTDQSQSQSAAETEEIEREEAEAILDALRVNDEDLIQRTYKPRGNMKLEKDW